MFDESLKEGESGEHVVWNLLQNQKNIRSIVDVRKDKKFQEKDIDFLVENISRQFTSIEVKTDFKAHETGNLVYELTTSKHIGCFEKTQAEYIMYYIPADKVVHMIDVVGLRTYIHKVRPEERKMGDNATGFLLPLNDLIKAKVIKYTFEGVM